MHLLNWRKDPFKPALCCNRHAKEEWTVGTACLREPVFDLCYRSLDLTLFVAAEGFFVGSFAFQKIRRRIASPNLGDGCYLRLAEHGDSFGHNQMWGEGARPTL